MNFLEFQKYLLQTKKNHPLWFDLKKEQPANDSEISHVESELKVVLPKLYKQFLTLYGGGYFAFTNIFSCNEDSIWYIVDINRMGQRYLPQNFVSISDDEAGGYYGYIADNGVCNERIYYWNHDINSVEDTSYDNILEYIVNVGLSR